ncbi:MAG TPA: tetratricopeptide repeat protein, partial [Chitinophagales bacterium]|nr:tetratricopeptide repeat protein [Chitinophagales bacterium]
PYFSMAVILHNKGQYEAAIPLYRKYLETHRGHLEAYANLSYAYFQMKDYNNAIAVNKEALAVDPQAFNPAFNIAKTFMAMQQPDSALYYLKVAQKIDPNHSDVNALVNQMEHK